MGKRICRAVQITSLCLLASTASLAAETAPRGWITTPDGPKHELTGVVCPRAIAGFAFTKLTLDGDASMLGRCHYPASGMEAWLRVREYFKGAGESQLAVEIDNTLMNPEPDQKWIAHGYRTTPGKTGDGRPYSDLVVTTRVGDLLVDCIVRRFAEDQDGAEFVAQCSGMLSRTDGARKS